LASGVLFVSTEGSNFDTLLAVFTGPGDDFSTLQLVACDNNSGADGKTSKVNFPATADTVYYIMVDGVKAATGTARLNYSLVTAPQLTPLDKTTDGFNRIQITLQPGGHFAVESSTNLTAWSVLLITNSPSTMFDFIDTDSSGIGPRFYRASGLP
jgi:hypothetical protein